MKIYDANRGKVFEFKNAWIDGSRIMTLDLNVGCSILTNCVTEDNARLELSAMVEAYERGVKIYRVKNYESK